MSRRRAFVECRLLDSGRSIPNCGSQYVHGALRIYRGCIDLRTDSWRLDPRDWSLGGDKADLEKGYGISVTPRSSSRSFMAIVYPTLPYTTAALTSTEQPTP